MLVALGRKGVSWELHLLQDTAATAKHKEMNLLCSAVMEQCCCFPGQRTTVCCLSQNASPPMWAPAPNFKLLNSLTLKGPGNRSLKPDSTEGFFLSHGHPQTEDHRESLCRRQTSFVYCNFLTVTIPPLSIYSIWFSHLFSLASGGFIVPCCRNSCL